MGPAAPFIPKLVTNESIAGSTTTSTVDCPATAYLYPPAVRPGQRWGATCVLASPAKKVLLTGQALGPATMVVGGHAVSVEPTCVHPHLHRQRERHQPDRFLVRPRQRTDRAGAGVRGVTQGSVRYSENMEVTLTGLTPAR